MTTQADGHAAEFIALLYEPGNPAFPPIPNPDAAVSGLFLVDNPNVGAIANKLLGTNHRIQSKHIRQNSLGSTKGGHGDWYKNQWWITPRPIDFGNVISEKALTITVLSTWLDGDHTLDDIDISGLGAGLTATIPSPTTMGFTEQIDVVLTAAAAGASVFDANAIWTFDNLTIAITVSGRRVVLIPYIPQANIQEQLSWVTDIMKSRNGLEQRHSLRLTPRQTIDYVYVQNEGTDATRLRTIFQGVLPLLCGVPIWWEAQHVTAAASAGSTNIDVNTDYIDHRVGGSILVLRPDGVSFDAEIDVFDSVSITTVNVHPYSIPLGSLIMPVRIAHIIGQPALRDYAADGLQTNVRYETADNVDLEITGSPETGDFPTLNGIVIFSDKNFMNGRTANGSIQMDFQKADNVIGVPSQYLQETVGDQLIPKGVEIQESLSEIRRWRSLLHYLRGSWKSFYIPTFRNDIVPITGFTLSSSTFTAEDSGAATYIGNNEPHAALMLELTDGRQFFTTITSIVDNGDGTETFTLDTPWGSQSPDDAISVSAMKISWLNLARMEGDTATFIHEYVGTASLRFTTRSVQN